MSKIEHRPGAPAAPSPAWSTAAMGIAGADLPLEFTVLGEHLGRCRQANGRLSMLRSGAEAFHGFACARFVTTLTAIVLAMGAVLLMLR